MFASPFRPRSSMGSCEAANGISTNPYGGATLYLSNNGNTFDGPILFQNGALQFDTIGDINSGPSALGDPKTADDARITLSYYYTSINRHYPASLVYSGSGTLSTNRPIRLNANGSIESKGAGAITFTADLDVSVNNIARTLTLGGTSTGDNTYAGDIVDRGPTYPTSIAKARTGKWILSGDNTYGGTTTVSAGTLLINGTHTGGGDYTVAAGATFGGSGVIGASSNISLSGTLAPGGSLGTLTAGGDFVTNNGAIYEWELGDGVQDLMAVGGNLTINSTLTVVLRDAGVQMIDETDKLDLFTYVGTLSLGNVVIDDQFVAGLPRWDTSNMVIGYDADSVFITGLSVVPEPSTFILSAFGLLGLALCPRRRKM